MTESRSLKNGIHSAMTKPMAQLAQTMAVQMIQPFLVLPASGASRACFVPFVNLMYRNWQSTEA